MKKFLALLLAFTLIFTIIGCRSNAPQNNTSSTLSSDDLNQSPPDSLDNSSSDMQSVVFPHYSTTTVNQTDATCVTNGYTGDTLCTACNTIIENGTQINAIGHDTEIRNRQDATTSSQGYSGDSYCKICGMLIATGEVIPPLQEVVPAGKIKYTSDNGYVYIVDKAVDITEYSMSQQTKYITHKFYNIELEIFNLCNAEREKAGLAPLVWYEEAYYFTHIRAEEIYLKWDHKRPNNSDWYTVYTNADVILQSCAENLAEQQGGNDIAEGVVDAWMTSTSGHRESILNPNFTKVAIAVNYVEDDYTYCVAQHFFG